jgi:hypothetical protein
MFFIKQTQNWIKEITVDTQSKAWSVFAHLNTGVMGLNPTWSMDVCVRCSV